MATFEYDPVQQTFINLSTGLPDNNYGPTDDLLIDIFGGFYIVTLPGNVNVNSLTVSAQDALVSLVGGSNLTANQIRIGPESELLVDSSATAANPAVINGNIVADGGRSTGLFQSLLIKGTLLIPSAAGNSLTIGSGTGSSFPGVGVCRYARRPRPRRQARVYGRESERIDLRLRASGGELQQHDGQY